MAGDGRSRRKRCGKCRARNGPCPTAIASPETDSRRGNRLDNSPYSTVYPVENMTLQRMKLLLVGFLGIVLFIWTTSAVGQQVKKIDDKALKAAGKGTEWTTNG